MSSSSYSMHGSLPLWVLLLALAFATARAEVTVDGVSFPEQVTINATVVPLRGVENYRYLFFRVHVGALYIPADVPPAEVLSANVPKRLELEYQRPISADDFRKSGNRLLEKQQDAATLRQLADRLETLNAAYRDMEPGDRYALEYAPGRGTRLLQNGTPLALVPGRDFAEVYFGIWLHPQNPLSRDFRDQLIQHR
ncbi:MAG: chalcone isomerase family protein [Thioalkalivibrio sp.]|nr:chalcone isomerase family protein [Thioalkalivibrio sp.]